MRRLVRRLDCSVACAAMQNMGRRRVTSRSIRCGTCAMASDCSSVVDAYVAPMITNVRLRITL